MGAALDEFIVRIAADHTKERELTGAAGAVGDVIADLASMYGPETTPADLSWTRYGAPGEATCQLTEPEAGYCYLQGDHRGDARAWTIDFSWFGNGWSDIRATYND